MKDKKSWEGKGFSFFTNTKCEYFPCHKTENLEDFNCIFCYCPLYALGNKCGGNFKILGNGIKDCSDCCLPHKRENYGYVTEKYKDIMEITKRNSEI